MPLSSQFRWLLIGLLLFSPANVWAIETVLEYSLTETHIPSPILKKGAKPEKETHVTTKKKVILGEDFFVVQEGKLERIYDFKNRRIHYLDHREKTQIEISLFADPAFRIAELQNRLSMDAAVKQAGGQSLDDLFSLECIFGVENEVLKIDLKEDLSQKGKTVFLENGQNRSEIIWGDKPAVYEGTMFSKFLIYDNSVHPIVRRKIVDSGKIPSVIRNQLQSQGDVGQFVLILDSFKTRADQGFNLPKQYAASKRRPGAVSSAESLAKVIRSTEIKKNRIPKHDQAWFLERIQNSQTMKHFLDSALLIVEYGLQTGDQATAAAEMQKLALHQKEDVELDRFFRSLGISGPEQAKRAIAELKKINRKDLSRAHVLDIMIANQLSVLGQNAAAQKQMIAALKVNPYVAGAYKDLGDMYYAEFDMVSAWMCWNFARKQAPDHFMLAPISEYETTLLKDFSDFF